MKSIFPAAIDGDLLKLVHLSNSFRMVGGAKLLQVGDICHPEARIISVTNSTEGKIVKVNGHCYRGNQSIIEVVSSFLYRGRFGDYENIFDTTELMLESCNQRNGLSGKTCHHHFWRVLHLFSAFNPRSSSRTRPPIVMFPSLVISSFGTNSRCWSKLALWISNGMIHMETLFWLICNATERLRV
jgi:hypothetical protein